MRNDGAEAYKNKLRFKLLRESNLLGPKKVDFTLLLEDTHALNELDQIIYEIAFEVLGEPEHAGFHSAFLDLNSSWENVAEYANTKLGHEITAETADTYAVKAANKIRKIARDEGRLDAWAEKMRNKID